jgi:hypothetical protein
MTFNQPPGKTRPTKANGGAPFLVTPFIIIAAFLQCAGWLLSALHQLNTPGYAVVLVLLATFLWWNRACLNPGRIRAARFRRTFPRVFLALALLATLGGAIHPPANYDGLTYRIPRVLHWLAEGQWHWIHSTFHRLNVRSTGWEWLAAPVLSLGRSYRWLFLINSAAYLLLPGLAFSVFTRLGLRRMVAWHWMWLMPAGLCYLLQAGSISNDSYAAVYALAALDFALRAAESRKPSDVWLSILCAALLSSSKLVNLPLLLPCLIAIVPQLGLLRARLIATAGVVLCATAASFIPIAVLNWKNCGDWSAISVEQGHPPRGGPLLFIPINAVGLTVQNLAPPIFPMSGSWNARIERKLPASFLKRLEGDFERPTSFFTLGQMEIEEGAGLGLGITLLLLVSAAAGFGRCQLSHFTRYQWILLLSPWVSLLAFLDKCSVGDQSRLVAAYYPLLIPLFLCGPRLSHVVRTRWWRGAAFCAVALSMLPLVVSPARPLWPALTVLNKLDAAHSQRGLLRRANDVYSVYAGRADAFAPARDQLPPGLKVLGVITWDDPESSLWLPIGSRRIEHVLASDSLDYLRGRGIEYVLVSPAILESHFSQTFDEWAARMRVQRLKTIPLLLRAAVGSTDWILVRLPPS